MWIYQSFLRNAFGKKFRGVKYKMARRPRILRRKRRVVRRRPIRRAKTTLVNKSLQPIPDRYICKMKYATSVTTAAANGQYVFRLNSLFDPDFSGVGHQPYGFDNLALLYNRYRVVSCGWRIQQPSRTDGSPIIVAALPSNDAALLWADYGEMAENPRTKYVTNNPGAPVATLSGKQYLPRLIGRTRAQYMADDNYQSVVNTNPVEQAFLYLNTFLGQTGVPVGSVPLNVVLEYSVEFFDAKHILQS